MSYNIHVLLAVLSMLFALTCSLVRWKMLDTPTKIIALAISAGLLNEMLAYISSVVYGTNIPVYNIYGVLELAIVAFYFNSSVQSLSRSKVGLIVSLLGALIWIINFSIFQPIAVFNSYFILFEGFCIIALALFALSQLLLSDEDLRLTKYPHFWFTIIILSFWCINYLNWGMYDILYSILRKDMSFIHMGMLIVNISLYWCLGLVFLFYKKMQLKSE